MHAVLRDAASLAAPLTALALLACGSDATVDPTKASTLVKRIADEVGPVTSIECPGDVQAVSGVGFECVATFVGGARHPATVTLTSIDGSDVRGAATWSAPLFGARQRADIQASITQKLGVAVAVQCKDEVMVLPVGERARCAARGAKGDVAIDVWFEAGGDLGWALR
jgi:hypothetical protein